MGWGYTCFVSAFAIFLSEKEIKIQKSQVVQYFSNINTVDAFNALNLPIRKVTECGDGTLNKAFEIDLNQQRKIEKVIGCKKLDCFPIMWVVSTPSKTEWTIKFQQRLACKYLVLKLIDSHKNNLNDNNIDMYNLTLNGFTLKIPSSSSSQGL